jgi:hypothetical protein
MHETHSRGVPRHDARLKSELAKLGKLVKAADIKPEQ